MSLAPLLRKVFLVDLFKGMKVTFQYQNPRQVYTEQYPLERPQVAERYRGLPRLNVKADTGETMCIACDLCALACPEHLIVVTSDYHTRRSLWIFSRVLRKGGVSIGCYPAISAVSREPDMEKFLDLNRELIKYLYYRLRYREP